MNCEACNKPLPKSTAPNLKYHKKCKEKIRYELRKEKIQHFRDMAQMIVDGNYTLRQLGSIKPPYDKIVMGILKRSGKIFR